MCITVNHVVSDNFEFITLDMPIVLIVERVIIFNRMETKYGHLREILLRVSTSSQSS